jgi:pimeloyl-ACP methyl ester carboxylesterase
MAPTNHSRRDVTIGEKRLEGELAGPADPQGLIIFAHGSGSSRHSPRNTFVAESLRRRGFATLLIDLLTEAEAGDRRNVFDIHLLAERVVEALAWARGDGEAGALPIGLFGASTGAAAALVAAAAAPDDVAAVVSRGGRPDLAGAALDRVRAPVLLIVGGADAAVLDLNRSALARLTAIKKLEIVPGATHLFEEPGALEAVVVLAANWFEAYCRREAS